ncbi:MAG: cell wall hydrolase [Pontixanthobacter sp.]
MARKTHFAGFAAIAATTTVIFFSADSSDAYAEHGIEIEVDAATSEPSRTIAPIFVAEEMAQTISERPQAAKSPVEPETLRELVAATDTGYDLSPEMRCLAKTVHFESRGEPLAGQLAVAQVVINRAESDRFPASYCGVVYQRSQFSFVKGGAMPAIRHDSKAWTRAKAIARIAHDGDWTSEAADALYFHARYVTPGWSRNRTRRASIATHLFYR